MTSQEEQWLLKEKYGGEKCEAFFTDLELLKSGTPLAYLIGSIPFLDCTIHLDSHPLIPRPETEYWAEKAIVSIRQYVRTDDRTDVNVLDLCAGSGAIGIAVAKAVPEAQVDLTDIDAAHLHTVEKNIEQNLTKPFNRLNDFTSDLFENIPQENKYHFILTNPPYVDPEIDRAEPSVKLHEPHLALYGGAEGMECIGKIIAQAPEYLTNDGQLWIEHEPEQVVAIMKLALENNFSVTTHNDQYNTPRYSVLCKSVSQ